MGNEGHEYSIEELMQLEPEANETNNTNIGIREVFSYLEDHSQFSHIDQNGPENSISYYFHNPNDGCNLLFIDIPREKGGIHTDENSCLGREEWFDELFEFTKKMHNHNNK